MYAFRKPFTANSYTEFDDPSWQISFKIALILAQVFGYLCAKFIGVKVIAEMRHQQRGLAIIGMIAA
ncbi:DUF5690 family protein, partial [Enterococcus faecium]|uniref:DUF5690 family protein n=1 Tax=Enterococcus faecium TaxID=1352 RepID=UPI0034E93835